MLTEPMSAWAVDRLRGVADVIEARGWDEQSVAESIGDCDGLVVRSKTAVTAAVLDAAPRLRVVGRAGVGLDRIDVQAAHARGVKVVYTPWASTNAVAELAVGLMLSLERHIAVGDRMVRASRYAAAREALVGRELRGLTLGVVGMGRIGSAVAGVCCAGLGMRIVYNDIGAVGPFSFDARAVDKEALYADSDVVSLHVPLTGATRGMIGEAELAVFKPTTTLINTSRGAVVNSGALASALGAGRLAGAALDVLDVEPPPGDHALLTAPRCLLSPHVGARTPQALGGMEGVVEDVIAVLEGRLPRHSAD